MYVQLTYEVGSVCTNCAGTMVDSNYEHFAGTAQVMKAVQSHMVLTFCAPLDRHFSIVLARAKYLSHEEVNITTSKQLIKLALLSIPI